MIEELRNEEHIESVLEPIDFNCLEHCLELRNFKEAKYWLLDNLELFKTVEGVTSLENFIQRYLTKVEVKVLGEIHRQHNLHAILGDGNFDHFTSPGSNFWKLLHIKAGVETDCNGLNSPLTFLWLSYVNCLELSRIDQHLESLYHQISHRVFQFCVKYNCRDQFRKLCIRLRNHLKGISELPESTCQLNLNTRLMQLDYALQMDSWQEACQGAEDFIRLLDLSQRPPPAQTLVRYHHLLAQLFWKCGQYLLHAAALYKQFQLTKDHQMAGKVLVATLSIPLPSTLPQSDDLIKNLDMSKEKTEQLAVRLLFFHDPPTRETLLSEILSQKVLGLVPPRLQELYYCLEKEDCSLTLCSQVAAACDGLEGDSRQYTALLRDTAAVRLLGQVCKVYQTIQLSRLLELTTFTCPARLERLLADCVLRYDMKICIDQRSRCVNFEMSGASLNQVVDIYNMLHMSLQLICPTLHQVEQKKHMVKEYFDTQVEERQRILARLCNIEDPKKLHERHSFIKVNEETQAKEELTKVGSLTKQEVKHQKRLRTKKLDQPVRVSKLIFKEQVALETHIESAQCQRLELEKTEHEKKQHEKVMNNMLQCQDRKKEHISRNQNVLTKRERRCLDLPEHECLKQEQEGEKRDRQSALLKQENVKKCNMELQFPKTKQSTVSFGKKQKSQTPDRKVNEETQATEKLTKVGSLTKQEVKYQKRLRTKKIDQPVRVSKLIFKEQVALVTHIESAQCQHLQLEKTEHEKKQHEKVMNNRLQRQDRKEEHISCKQKVLTKRERKCLDLPEQESLKLEQEGEKRDRQSALLKQENVKMCNMELQFPKTKQSTISFGKKQKSQTPNKKVKKLITKQKEPLEASVQCQQLEQEMKASENKKQESLIRRILQQVKEKKRISKKPRVLTSQEEKHLVLSESRFFKSEKNEKQPFEKKQTHLISNEQKVNTKQKKKLEALADRQCLELKREELEKILQEKAIQLILQREDRALPIAPKKHRALPEHERLELEEMEQEKMRQENTLKEIERQLKERIKQSTNSIRGKIVPTKEQRKYQAWLEFCLLEEKREKDEIKRHENAMKEIYETSLGQDFLKKLGEDEKYRVVKEYIDIKERDEMQRYQEEKKKKLLCQEKRLYINEYVKRLHEIPQLKNNIEEKKEADRQYLEQQEVEIKLALEQKQRLARMHQDRDTFLEKIKTQRRGDYEEKLAQFQVQLDEERKKRLLERKIKREEKRRTAWIRERKEEDKLKEIEEKRKKQDEMRQQKAQDILMEALQKAEQLKAFRKEEEEGKKLAETMRQRELQEKLAACFKKDDKTYSQVRKGTGQQVKQKPSERTRKKKYFIQKRDFKISFWRWERRTANPAEYSWTQSGLPAWIFDERLYPKPARLRSTHVPWKTSCSQCAYKAKTRQTFKQHLNKNHSNPKMLHLHWS